MLRFIDENGTKMVAVVLGEADGVSIEGYRRALFEVFQYAALNQEMFPAAQIKGMDLFNYVRLIRAFEGDVEAEDTNGKGDIDYEDSEC